MSMRKYFHGLYAMIVALFIAAGAATTRAQIWQSGIDLALDLDVNQQ